MHRIFKNRTLMRILNTLIHTRLRGVCVMNKINYNTLCCMLKRRINAFGRPWDSMRAHQQVHEVG